MAEQQIVLDKIVVLGLWHQGVVGSACLAAMGYTVTGADLDIDVINNLKNAKTPIYEPGLESLIQEGIKSNKLNFEKNLKESVKKKRIVFLMNDTPVDENDKVDLSSINQIIDIISPEIMEGAILCVTAQVPVGTCEKIEKTIKKMRPNLNFGIAYIPENLRLGEAIKRYYQPDMPVIGTQKKWVFDAIKKILNFTNIKWIHVDLKTSEMSKHALNTFLATSITFANELGSICDRVGADGVELAKILRLEPRIGSKAMLMPGLGFSGGTLARDTQILRNLGKEKKIKTHFLDGLWQANIKHNHIVKEMLLNDFESLKNLKISILGLTYKPNTSTLRRSISISTIEELYSSGAFIQAYDPMVNHTEIKKYKSLSFFSDVYEAITGTDILVIMTGWNQFKDLNFKLIKTLMNGNYIFDTNNMLDFNQMSDLGFIYKCIGRGK